MAQAKVTQEKIPVTTYKEGPNVFTLTLSHDEVLVVLAITGRITGNRSTSPRQYSDKIYWSLVNKLNDYSSASNPFSKSLETGVIRFADTELPHVENEPATIATVRDYGREYVLTMGENTAKTLQALLGRVEVNYTKGYTATHEIFRALSSVDVTMDGLFPTVGICDYGKFYQALSSNIVFKDKPEKQPVKVVKKAEEDWPPRLNDVWTTGKWAANSSHWIATRASDEEKIKLHINGVKNPIWFDPETVKESFPDIKLAYRDTK